MAPTTPPPPQTAEIRAALERGGQVVGACDLIYAGRARSRGLVVVTNNLRVDALRREDRRA